MRTGRSSCLVCLLIGSLLAASNSWAETARGRLHRLLAAEPAAYRPARIALAREFAGWFFAIREVVSPRPERLAAAEAIPPIRPRPLPLLVATRTPKPRPARTDTVREERHPASVVATRTAPARPTGPDALPRMAGTPLDLSTGDLHGTAPGSGWRAASLLPRERDEEVDPVLYAVAALARGQIETGGENWKLDLSVSRDLDTVKLRLKHRFASDW